MINADDEVTLAYLLSPEFEISNTEGRPLTGGYIEVYLHGTRSKYYCYSDWNGSLHPFKIPLDSLGANIILASPAHAYDIYVYNKFGSLIMSRYNIVPATSDGGTIYTAGDAIDITGNAISVKYSKGLELNSYNQLEVKYGKGLELNSDNRLEVKSGKGLTFDNNNLKVSVGKGINFDSNGKLTTELPDDWIEITNEWIFINNFRLQYNGDLPGYGNEMTIWYSKIRKLVKFTGTMRVNTPSSFSNSAWHVFMQYTGNRFYTTHNAPYVSLAPKVYPTQIGGITSVPATSSTGVTLSALMKLSYIGSPDSIPEYCGLGMQLFIPSNTAVNGAVMEGLQLSVTPIE